MTDTDLLDGCLRQDRKAQRTLYEKQLPYLLAIVRRYGVREADLQDVLQEAFSEIFATLERFDPTVGPLRPWLARITIHRTLNHFRRNKRIDLTGLDEALKRHVNGSPEVVITNSAEHILAEIDRLPPAYRIVFNLHLIDGYSHAEIGRLLSISPEGSRTRLNRARTLMRERLSTSIKLP